MGTVHDHGTATEQQPSDLEPERVPPAGSSFTPSRLGAFSAGQSYRTSSPVRARPMIMRWISEVPSKIVKLSDVDARD